MSTAATPGTTTAAAAAPSWPTPGSTATSQRHGFGAKAATASAYGRATRNAHVRAPSRWQPERRGSPVHAHVSDTAHAGCSPSGPRSTTRSVP